MTARNFTTKAAFFESLRGWPDVERLPWGAWAVPHASHIPGNNPTSILRERACVFDAGTFIHVSCGCNATPHELAEDFDFAEELLLQPLAEEQSLMMKVQRRLREDLHDQQAREFLALRNLTVAQALMWRPSDAGCPADSRGSDLASQEIEPCGSCGADWVLLHDAFAVGEAWGIKHRGDCPRRPPGPAFRFAGGGVTHAP